MTKKHLPLVYSFEIQLVWGNNVTYHIIFISDSALMEDYDFKKFT